MTKYYRLDANLNIRAGYMKQQANGWETLLLGEPVDESKLVLPWPFTLRPDGDEVVLSDYYPGKKLMSSRLVDTIKAAGVDNLQIFPAVITNQKSGEVNRDYVVVNVLGMVAAADQAKSDSVPLADVQFFKKLVLDPARTRELLLFRLAESRADLIVAEKVAERIKAGKFVDVVVEPLSG
jgi:hypothetical protein